MIEIENLVKTFRRKKAVGELSLSLEKGGFMVVFGPNGSGKTTLIKLIATLLKPTSGAIEVNGIDTAENGPEARKHIGLLSHDTYLYEELTGIENLRFYTRLYGIPWSEAREKEMERMLEAVGLLHRKDDRVGTFSRGMKQRLAIIRANVHGPRVLLLDEPYTGLDSRACETLNKMLLEFRAAGKTVLMSTHDMEMGHAMAERLVILKSGRLVLDAPKKDTGLDEFRALYKAHLEGA